MKAFKYNETIEILGVSFNGVRDIIRHAVHKEPKDGVYVGKDSKLYPCFDIYDLASEDRFYWNFVFAKSQEALDAKLSALKEKRQTGMNYMKLTDDLHPMAYWGGEDNYDVYVTEPASDERK